MSTSQSWKPAQREMIASITEEIEDDVFIDENQRQKNIWALHKDFEKYKN